MFFLRRKKRIKVRTSLAENGGYYASATNGYMSVYDSYGSTKEAAIEMALFRLRKFEEEEAEKEKAPI
jgi:hypothetical protein